MAGTRTARAVVLAGLPARLHARLLSGPAARLLIGLLIALLAGLLAMVLGAELTGATAPQVLGSGAVVRWGLPAARLVADLSCALTIGALVLAAVALPTTATPDRPRRPRAYRPALVVATASAAVWAVSGLVLLVLTCADLTGVGLGDPAFGGQLAAFALQVDVLRGLAVGAGVAALVALAAAAATTLRAAGLLALLSLAALMPPALSGHAAGAADHETAVTSLGLHLLGVTVWVGGLSALALLWRGLPDDGVRSLAAQRFSTIAGCCFVVVAISGGLNAAIRVGDLAGLRTSYGALVLLKVAALAVLGGFGWRHRRASLPALEQGRSRAFLRLAGVELLVMAAAFGLASALSRSAPPVPAVPPATPSPAQTLTGYPMPGQPSAASWLTQWQPDLLWVTVGLLAAGLYLTGVGRLRRRGDRWPLWRTAVWLLGLAVLTWATSGPPAVYGRVLFSAHMLGHLTLSMLVPMLAVSAAPVTLALRAVPPRHDGTRGPREWLLAVLESRLLRVLCHPVVAAVLFAFSLVAFYYSRLFELALTTHVGHELMDAHFLAVGYLFMWVLMGADPGPPRPAPPIRMLMLLATMAFHAFFGVALMMSRAVLAPGYYGGLGRSWGSALLPDQQLGGALAWGIGDLPTLAVALVIAVQWSRADDREARRRDRAADRDDDAELAAYNAMLARMAGQDHL